MQKRFRAGVTPRATAVTTRLQALKSLLESDGGGLQARLAQQTPPSCLPVPDMWADVDETDVSLSLKTSQSGNEAHRGLEWSMRGVGADDT